MALPLFGEEFPARLQGMNDTNPDADMDDDSQRQIEELNGQCLEF